MILKQVSLSNKWANELNRHFSKEKCKWLIKLKNLSCQHLEIKSFVGLHITPIRIANFKNKGDKISLWDAY